MKTNVTRDTNNNTIRYMYLRDPKNSKRVVTVARMVNTERNEVVYGLSVCCPGNRDELGYPIDNGDPYNKRRGRDIATGRLLTTVTTREPLATAATRRLLATLAEVPLNDGDEDGPKLSWDTGIVTLPAGVAPSRAVLKHIEEVEHRAVVRRTIQHALVSG